MVERSASKRVIICTCQMPPIEVSASVETFGGFKKFMEERKEEAEEKIWLC